MICIKKRTCLLASFVGDGVREFMDVHLAPWGGGAGATQLGGHLLIFISKIASTGMLPPTIDMVHLLLQPSCHVVRKLHIVITLDLI